MNLNQVSLGNSSFEIKREKIGLDIFENRLFFSYEPKLNSFSWDDKT